MNERRPIPAAPGYTIDRAGQVYRHHEVGRVVRVPSDARGRLKLSVGRSVTVANRRDLLATIWPEEVVVESTVATLDTIEATEFDDETPEPADDFAPEIN